MPVKPAMTIVIPTWSGILNIDTLDEFHNEKSKVFLLSKYQSPLACVEICVIREMWHFTDSEPDLRKALGSVEWKR